MAYGPVITALPEINAAFNALSGVLLLAGRLAIARGARTMHRNLMLTAFASSTLFLIGYLTRIFTSGPKHFEGLGLWKTLYFAILISHMILAVAVVPLSLSSIWFGLKDRLASHRKVVRWTFPIWMYVSVTGVVVYGMLYHWPL
jgi:uncharacterized membrane protein YozB (DUF420 family)